MFFNDKLFFFHNILEIKVCFITNVMIFIFKLSLTVCISCQTEVDAMQAYADSLEAEEKRVAIVSKRKMNK